MITLKYENQIYRKLELEIENSLASSTKSGGDIRLGQNASSVRRKFCKSLHSLVSSLNMHFFLQFEKLKKRIIFQIIVFHQKRKDCSPEPDTIVQKKSSVTDLIEHLLFSHTTRFPKVENLIVGARIKKQHALSHKEDLNLNRISQTTPLM